MSRKLRASQMEFDALVDVLANVPFRGPGQTAAEILERVETPYAIPTLVGILSTQVSRGWVVTRGRGKDRRYLRTILHVEATLAELITVV